MDRFNWEDFAIIVTDEAQHSVASTYLKVYTDAGVLLPGSKKLLLGVTATPKRRNLKRTKKQHGISVLDEEDILSLKSVYQSIVYKYTIREAVRDGWLVPLKGFRLKTDTDLEEVKTTAGDYSQEQLSDTVNTTVRNQQIVKAWLDYGENRTTLAFSVDIKHAQDLAQIFSAYGVKCEAVWGKDPERANKIARLRNGTTTILVNCALLVEGFDAWEVGCIILAKPTKSSSLFTQMIGRGTRLEEGTGNIIEALKEGKSLRKKDVYILDVVDNNKKCSLVTFPSLLGLNPETNLHGESITEVIEKLEKFQEKYPGIDLTGITDINKVEAYVESLDIFATPFTEEVKEFSTLSWITTNDGEYVLPIPEKKDLADAAKRNNKVFARYLHEKLHLKQNELDEWELSLTSTTVGERKLGTFNELKEAFEVADDVIQRNRYDRVKLMLRESPRDNYPASEPAKKYLRKLSKKRPLLYCLCPASPMYSPTDACPVCKKKMGITSGMASIAINKLQHAR